MPTGYTACVQSGEITDFRDFAMICARAFGAMISMRDDPLDEPYRPEEVSLYHSHQIDVQKEKLDRLKRLSDEQIAQEWRDDYAERLKESLQRRDEKLQQAARYREMLWAVERWTPPTSEHVGLKDFMTEQLKRSLDSDCRISVYDGVHLLECQDWHSQRIKWTADMIVYHEEEHRKEIERVASRNRWVEDLLASLGSDTVS